MEEHNKSIGQQIIGLFYSIGIGGKYDMELNEYLEQFKGEYEGVLENPNKNVEIRMISRYGYLA